MENAKHSWLLSNGVSVVAGDKVEIITKGDNKKYIGVSELQISCDGNDLLSEDNLEKVIQAVENNQDINARGTELKLYKRHKYEFGYYDNDELFITININPKKRVVSFNLWEDVVDGSINPDTKCVMRYTENEFERFANLIN